MVYLVSLIGKINNNGYGSYYESKIEKTDQSIANKCILWRHYHNWTK